MRILKLRCKFCGYWNRVPVNKILVEQDSPEPKVKVMIPMYEPLETSKCEKCGKIITESKESNQDYEKRGKIIGKREDLIFTT